MNKKQIINNSYFPNLDSENLKLRQLQNELREALNLYASFDLDFDRVIGEDARQKWETIYQRRRDKWDIINRNNVTGKEIVRMEDGSYDSVPDISSKMRTSRISAMDKIKTQTHIETKEK